MCPLGGVTEPSSGLKTPKYRFPPLTLKLKKTSESPTTLSYLDIHITIKMGNIPLQCMINEMILTCKIVNFSYLSSNIPSRPAYGVYISQLVRIGRICSDYLDFTLRHFKLTERLVDQGYRYSDLCMSFYKFAKRHAQIMNKYSCSIRKHVEDGNVYQQWIGSSVAVSRIDRNSVTFWNNISIFNISIFLFLPRVYAVRYLE